MNPKVSVVTVNYNGFDHTCGMIESLARHVTMPIEVIVVDNGSRQDEAERIGKRYPHVRTIRSPKNLGFAGGNNLGIRAARGEHILLLNNDAFVEDDTLVALCDRLDGDSSIGAVCPKIRFAQPPRPVQFAGYTPLSRITLRNALIGFGRPDDGSLDTPHPTPYAHGAAMMVRRKAIDDAGPMPEIYFLYYEEIDWSTRIAEAGYSIWYEPRCTVFHKESASTGADSPLKAFYLTRNRLLYGWRNRRGPARWLTILYQTGIAAPKNMLSALASGRADLARAMAKGVAAFFRLPDKTDRL